jgi:hypothetical protein
MNMKILVSGIQSCQSFQRAYASLRKALIYVVNFLFCHEKPFKYFMSNEVFYVPQNVHETSKQPLDGFGGQTEVRIENMLRESFRHDLH